MPSAVDNENIPLNDALDSAAPDGASDPKSDKSTDAASPGPVTTSSGNLSDLPAVFELEAQKSNEGRSVSFVLQHLRVCPRI